METNTSGTLGISYIGEGLGSPMVVPNISASATVTRQRFVELVALASETVRWLEEKGLKNGEQCEFRQIAERLWFAPKQ